ncbi:hypothetical protein diail_582 [Diaporthe ilicicola]|nr:hypothetical protein diail_582 [Diaporthe ilicicola]
MNISCGTGIDFHLRSLLKRRQSLATNFATSTNSFTFVDSLDQARKILEQREIITVQATNDNHDLDQPTVADTGLPDENPSAALEVARPVLEIGHDKALSHLASSRDQIFPSYP